MNPAALTKRFVRYARLGWSGRGWYDSAREWACTRFGPAKGSLLLRYLAATSPRASIYFNLRFALRALRDHLAGALGRGYGVPANDASCTLVALGRPLTGPKVGAFDRALAGDPDAMALDVWMARLADCKGEAPTRIEAEGIRRAIRSAARILDCTPAEIQASAWCAIRAERGSRAHGPATYGEALGAYSAAPGWPEILAAIDAAPEDRVYTVPMVPGETIGRSTV